MSTHDLVRGRQDATDDTETVSYFNSRPRERPTRRKKYIRYTQKISTHDLVRGRQKEEVRNLAEGGKNFNSRPRERPTTS